MNVLYAFVIAAVLCAGCSQGARIVAFFTVGTASHKMTTMPILEALAERGHQVTVVSSFQTEPTKNVKEIVLASATKNVEENDFNWFEVQKQSSIFQLGSLVYSAREMFTQTYSELMADERVKQIMRERQVDLIISDGFSNEMVFPIIDHLKVPYVLACSMPNLAGLYRTIGAYDHYATVPVGLTDCTEEMSFFERLGNIISLEYFLAVQNYFVIDRLEELARRDFPDGRPIREIAKDVSLIVVNTHPSFAFQRPLPPSVIPASYLHTRPAHPLPEPFKTFTDEAKDGFIIFTLGSYMKSSSMPKEIIQAFMNVFAKLSPYRIIWKWESERPLNISANVLMSPWLPQQDLLGHPHAKLFITHGGLAGIQETIYHGVPILGLPFFGDQRSNLAKAVTQGYALKLNWDDVDETRLHDTIRRLLDDKSFQQNATRLSKLVRDELLPGRDVAVYWIEHVLRHGAQHLQLSAKDMPFYQRHLLDVTLFLILIALAIALSIYLTVRQLCNRRRSKKTKVN